MAEPATVSPFSQTVRWLADHARFPASRLPDKAELLVLFAAAAAGEDLAKANPYHVGMLKDPNFAANLRNYTAQRRKVHLVCDNSAKS
jgi:hypothetical protein